MRPTTTFVPAGLLALLVAAVTACSGSTSGKGSTSAHSAPGSHSASGKAPASSGGTANSGNAAPTKAQLTAMLLQATDLPTGWTATAGTGAGASDAKNQQKLTACTGSRNTYGDRVARADSNDFTQGTNEISSNAISFKSTSDVDSDVAMLHSSKIDQCFTQLAASELSDAAPSGAKVTSIKIHFAGRSSGQPDNVVANAAGSFDVSAQGQQATAYLNVAFVRGPQVEAEVQFVSVATPVDSTLRDQLVSKVAQRVKG
jgi:hypothetical protein